MSAPIPRRDLERRFPLGTEVECEVTRVEDWGVFVRLVDAPDVVGFIRRQDWRRSLRIFNLRSRVESGERLAGVVAGYHRGELRLEHGKPRGNPFKDFVSRHKIGDQVVGQVKLVAKGDAGILVALDAGVDGFIPRSELPETATHADGLGVLNGDLIIARILGFEKREVKLSVREHLRRRDQDYERRRSKRQTTFSQHPELGLKLESLYWDLQLREIHEPEVPAEVAEHIRKILVVEDKQSLADSLEGVLGHLGFECHQASTLEEGRRALAAETYDLLILDVNLSRQRGEELLRDLDAEVPKCLVVLTASEGVSWVEELDRRGDTMARVFQKPTSVESILRWLRDRLTNTPDTVHEERLFTAQESDTEIIPWGAGATTGHRASIQDLVDRLVQTTGAAQGVVLSYRAGPIFERVAGDFPALSRQSQQHLEFSPISDVILERKYLYVVDVAQKPAEFRHLAQVFEVGTFVGIGLEYSDQALYGLFLWGPTAGGLRDISEERLRRSAGSIGVHLANRRFNEVIAQNQGLLLTGFLADSLLHEIRNELQTLDDFSWILVMLAKRFGKSRKGNLEESDRADFSKSTVEVHQISQRLNQLVELFRNLAGKSPARIVDLNEALRRLAATLAPFAEEHQVEVDLDLADDLPELWVHPKLIDQPLLNLMINGVEQMADYGMPPRRLRVATEHRPEDDFPVRVSISDTGSGMHFTMKDRIFDPFFSTKRNGTGLGLYLSKYFIERFGGRLELAHTFRFVGSELTVEIPREVLVP